VTPEEFVASQTVIARAPLVPEIALHLASEITPIWQATEAWLAEQNIEPPFWAFAWPGGQALARAVLDDPKLVAGKRVLDFAAGSGLAGIAAAKAGAAWVEAVDIDAFALAAIGLNAAANGVTIAATQEDLVGRDGGWDVVLAGDVCYERDMAEAVSDWLAGLTQRGATVLIGDPGRSYLPRGRLESLATYQIATTRDLEDADVKRTSVWRFTGQP